MEPRTCVACGIPLESEPRFCPQCGSPQFKACPDCQKENSLDAGFCAACGTKIANEKAEKYTQPQKSLAAGYSPWYKRVLWGAVFVVMLAGIWFITFLQWDTEDVKNLAASGMAVVPQTQSTLKRLQSLLDKNPNIIQTWIQLGNLYYDTGNFDRAAFHYQHALRIDSTNSDVRVDLAVSYFKLNQSETAIAEMKKALRFDPGQANAYFNLGVVYNSLGNREEAGKSWNQYKTLRPDGELTDKIQSIMEEWD